MPNLECAGLTALYPAVRKSVTSHRTPQLGRKTKPSEASLTSLPMALRIARRMRMLIVAATDAEITALTAKLREKSRIASRAKQYEYDRHDLHILTTGVGMVATAAWCSQMLSHNRYEVAFNFGLCGAFDNVLELAQVVQVVSDRMADLGAENDEDFLTVQELKLLGNDEFPFTRGRLVNSLPPNNSSLAGLVAVDGITVNT